MEINVIISSENETKNTNEAINPAVAITAPALPIITEATTLGELIGMLNLGEKLQDTPTPKKLREIAGDPIAVARDPIGYGEGCRVYANGYAVYDNGSGRTVIWLPDCTSFIYFFVQPKDTEIGICPAKTILPEGELESQPWAIPVMLVGEHRIENLVHHRKSDRKESKALIRDDRDERNAIEEMDRLEDSFRKEFTWKDGRFGEDPFDYLLRKERQREMLKHMTDKQREVFVMYYQGGYTQREIALFLGISQQKVSKNLSYAVKKAKKIY